MNELHRLFAEALAQSGLDVAALDESDLCQLLQSKIIPECATSTLDELRRRAPDMLRERRAMEEGFRSRNFERWAQGFDLLEMLIVIADETGEAINNADRPMAVRENDAQFESVVTLHARSVLVAREILCLLKNGFADGALGRWRTLHEVAVVTQFLAKNEKNTSERYLLHRTIQSHKAMLQYRKYQEAANLEPFDEYDVREITEARNKIIAEYGGEMIHNWGWAAAALGYNKPTFFDIEKSLNLDHWRPRYRWAAQDTHGGYRPPTVLLGMAEAKEPLLLVGPSNSGLTDPAHMTAISLTLATSALAQLSPNMDRVIATQIMLTLSDEIGETFLKIDSERSETRE